MRNTPATALMFAALLGTTTAIPIFASGAYKGVPPKPPAREGETMDREKYGLGQKVYNGEAMTPGAGNVDAQATRLRAAQMKLPPDAMRTKDLVSLAGKLSPTQLDALEYFVDQRFSKKK